MAIDAKQAVQDVPYAKLRERLLADGQILEYAGPARSSRGGRDPEKLAGVVVDDSAAKLTGEWKESGAAQTFIGDGYQHDDNAQGRQGHRALRGEAAQSRALRSAPRLPAEHQPRQQRPGRDRTTPPAARP